MFTSETPDPTDADVPPILQQRRDMTTGKTYMQEVAMHDEAAASVALDGETQSFDTPPKEATVPTVSTRKPVKLKVGRQTETVTRIVRNRYEIGQEFTAKSIYNFFTTDDRTAWRRAYGNQAEVMDVLRKAIVNVKYSKKYLMLESVEGKGGTWKVISLTGEGRSTTKVSKPKPFVKKLTPAAGPDVPGYTLVGYNLDAKKLYKDKDGNLGTFEFTPYEL